MSRRAKITKRAIDAIVPPASGEINLWDSEVPGFGLRVRYTGSRVYVVEYRTPRSTQAPCDPGAPWETDGRSGPEPGSPNLGCRGPWRGPG